MSTSSAPPWIDELELSELRPPDFYWKRDQIDEAPLQQAHILRQAWDQLGLSGILCSDGRPVAYIAEVEEGNRERLRDLHQAIWSQGVAPLLLALGPTSLAVYSGLTLPTKRSELIEQGGRLVETLHRISQALEARQMVRALSVGTFFDAPSRSYVSKRSFNPRQRVDRYLLTNLNAARRELEAVTPLSFDRRAVHALLARLIFTCYLIDRGVIGKSYFEEIGILGCGRIEDILEKPDGEASQSIFALFKRLRDDFNGDLLEGDLDREEHGFTGAHLNILRRLLRGDDLTTKQAALAFWAYDFSIIPIETISAIYESFLEADDPEAKRHIGAYYTPRFLCEIVLDEATVNLPSLLGKRFLDPACGSGIFLVGLFNRLAEEWRRRHPDADNLERFRALVEIVRTSLFGIDINETACRISAFSLYLALLDQLQPRDIQQLPKPRLPKLVLLRADDTVVIDGLNIVCSDFFDPFLSEQLNGFDVVVGNPPWARDKRSLMEQWLHQTGQTVPQGQLAAGFMLKASLHATDEGIVSFLLPAGVLFNHQAKSATFQRKWLLTHTLHRVINLSDLRFYLFENAIRPTLCMTYTSGRPEPRHRVLYQSPKSDPETLRAEILFVGWGDTARIPLGNILTSIDECRPSLVWKRYFWATPRDRELLSRMDDLPRLADVFKPESKGGRGWSVAEGFQPMGQNDDPERGKENPIGATDLFIEAREEGLRLLVTPADCINAEKYATSDLRRMTKNLDIFRGPHVLVSHGLRAAFASFDVFFRHSLRGIHGPAKDSDLLMLLTALIDSDLIRYYLFHTSANWGIERDKVHLSELMLTPFPLPRDLDEDSQAAALGIAAQMRTALRMVSMEPFGKDIVVENLRSELAPLIARYFSLSSSEIDLITDTTKLWIPSSQPNRGSFVPALQTVRFEERADYVDTLCRELDQWMVRGKMSGEITIAPNAHLAVVRLEHSLSGRVSTRREHVSWPELDAALKRATAALRESSNTMSRVRELTWFDGPYIYLFKPLQLRYWSRSAAYADADEVAGAIAATKLEVRR